MKVINCPSSSFPHYSPEVINDNGVSIIPFKSTVLAFPSTPSYQFIYILYDIRSVLVLLDFQNWIPHFTNDFIFIFRTELIEAPLIIIRICYTVCDSHNTSKTRFEIQLRFKLYVLLNQSRSRKNRQLHKIEPHFWL